MKQGCVARLVMRRPTSDIGEWKIGADGRLANPVRSGRKQP